MYVSNRKTTQIMKLNWVSGTYTIVQHEGAEHRFWIYKAWREWDADGRRVADHKNILGKGTNLVWCFGKILEDSLGKPMAIVPADRIKELVDIKQKFVG